MRCIAFLLVCVVSMWSARPAFASACTLDSDCPSGMVCNNSGGCETPTSSNSGTSRPKMAAAGVVVAVLLLGLLVLSLTWNPSDSSSARTLPLEPAQPSSPEGGLSFHF